MKTKIMADFQICISVPLRHIYVTSYMNVYAALLQRLQMNVVLHTFN